MTMHVTPKQKNMLKLNTMEVAGYLWVVGIVFIYI